MELKIYVDVLFATNFFMDFILLYSSVGIMKMKPVAIRLLLASFIGAVFSCYIFFNNTPFVLDAILKIVVAVLMTYITFLPKNLVSFIKYVCTFFCISFLCGGVGIALFYYTDIAGYFGAVYANGTFYFNFPVYKLIFSVAICYFILRICIAVTRKYRKYKSQLYDVELTVGNNKASFKALLDNGNTLKESKTENGVLVVSWGAVKKLFDTDKSFKNFLEEDTHTFISIPYKSVSGHFIMPGFIPDNTKINGKEINVYVGISEIEFDDFYEAVLPYNINERVETI